MNPSVPAVFTVCNIAYLPKALVLADSLYQHQQLRLKVIVFDKKTDITLPANTIDITWVQDIGLPEWKHLAFQYDIIEFSTSLKAYISLRLFNHHEKVIFLDPDTAVFSSLNQIIDELDKSPVIITPHYTKPQPDTESESDLAMMRFGSFNLGFFAVKQGEEAQAFLKWWNRRCIDFSFMESQFGLSTDQKWVTIAPCFFDFLKISFNPGYNAAPWNTFEREITQKTGEEYVVNHTHKLVFFHFSNFEHADPQYLNKRASCEAGKSYELLEELGKEYSKKLAFYENSIDKKPYAFDYMSDGSYISPTLRRAFANIKNKLGVIEDPFDSNGLVGNFARRNNLLSAKTQVRYKYPSLKEAQKNKLSLKVIYFGMRILLKCLGPNRFYDLSKLMVYLSVLRKDHGYWKS